MTTSSDKTKNKLLDSMRMSKEGSSSTPAAAAAPAAKPATAAKPAASKKAAKKPAAKPAAKKPAASKKPAAKKAASGGSFSTREARAALIADTFESGQRIWPD